MQTSLKKWFQELQSGNESRKDPYGICCSGGIQSSSKEQDLQSCDQSRSKKPLMITRGTQTRKFRPGFQRPPHRSRGIQTVPKEETESSIPAKRKKTDFPMVSDVIFSDMEASESESSDEDLDSETDESYHPYTDSDSYDSDSETESTWLTVFCEINAKLRNQCEIAKSHIIKISPVQLILRNCEISSVCYQNFSCSVDFAKLRNQFSLLPEFPYSADFKKLRNQFSLLPEFPWSVDFAKLRNQFSLLSGFLLLS